MRKGKKANLFSEGTAGGSNPVLGVAPGGRTTEVEAGARGVLCFKVPEEAGGLQHPGPGASLKQHVLGGTQGHQGHRGWIHCLQHARDILQSQMSHKNLL